MKKKDFDRYMDYKEKKCKRTYIVNLTEPDIKRIVNGKTLKLQWVDFNIEIEHSQYHRISCLSKVTQRGGKNYE